MGAKLVVTPTIVFDLDGTLADTARDLVSTLNVILAREGIPPVGMEQARALIGAGARPLIQRGLQVHGRSVTAARLEALYQQFLTYYHEHIADETVLFPGVLKALERISEAGWRLAVCTNKRESHALQLLEKLGIMPLFAAISGQDSYGVQKPDPRHLTRTIESAGGHPEHAVMIGDSQTDIDTAKAARLPIVAVTFGYTPVHVSTFGPDAMIDHFDGLWDALSRVMAAHRNS